MNLGKLKKINIFLFIIEGYKAVTFITLILMFICVFLQAEISASVFLLLFYKLSHPIFTLLSLEIFAENVIIKVISLLGIAFFVIGNCILLLVECYNLDKLYEKGLTKKFAKYIKIFGLISFINILFNWLMVVGAWF